METEKRIDTEFTDAFFGEIEKIGLTKKQIFALAKKKGEIENWVLKMTRGKRPKHVLERIPPKMVRTRYVIQRGLRRLGKGGPTSWALGKTFARPRKRALVAAAIGGAIGAPVPPPIPAMMTLIPVGAAVSELPRILRTRRARKVSLARRAKVVGMPKEIIKKVRISLKNLKIPKIPRR